MSPLGMVLELTGDAAKCYDEVIQQLTQQPGEKCDQAMYWTEEALDLYCLM